MEEPFATFHLSASLPGVYIHPCPIPKCGSNTGSAPVEASEVSSSPAEDSYSGSALAQDFHFGPSPTAGSEDSFLAEDSGSGFDPVEDAESGAALAENLSANCALVESGSISAPSDDSGSGSALAEVPDAGSSVVEKSDSGSASPEDLDSEPSTFRCVQCPQCQSNEFLLHQCWICGSFQGECTRLILPTWAPWENWENTPTIKELRASAHNSSKSGKCEFCSILLSCLERCIPPDSIHNDFHFYTKTHEERHDLCLNEPWRCRNRSLLVVIGSDEFHIDASMEIFISPGSSSPWPVVQEAYLTPQNTASETSLTWAQESLQHCLKLHACCNIQKTDTLLPKRLVDVVHSRMNGSVRLIEKFGCERPYLCLSHCWGDPSLHPQPLKTTRDNLCRHLEGIPWDDLPKTFQDAVNFVRYLGERYIWIDSLCIIQDSTEDWTEESGKMASIYQNSFVTIAASKSNNSSGGCFSTPEVEFKAHPFTVKYSNGSRFTFYCRRSNSHWFHNAYYKEDVQVPLLERAWVYQERQLSPRTLHFGNREFVWECREELVCECDLWKRLPHDSLKFRKSFWPAVDDRNDLRGLQASFMPGIAEPTHEPNTVQIWHYAVQEYCRLSLTRASDRLPAIAGVARLMQTFRRNDEYLAGLWNNTLFEDLMWLHGRIVTDNRNTSLAPSWSWACIDKGLIEFESISDSDSRMASLVNVEVRPDGGDAYLNVPSGSLTVEGYLFTTRPENSLLIDRDSMFVDATGFGLGLYLSDDGSSSPRGQTHCLYGDSSEYQAGGLFPAFSKVVYLPDFIFAQSEAPHTTETASRCLWMVKKQRDSDGKFVNAFLVLRQKQSQDVYERVGVLRTIGSNQFELPPVSEQPDGALKHTITIV